MVLSGSGDIPTSLCINNNLYVFKCTMSVLCIWIFVAFLLLFEDFTHLGELVLIKSLFHFQNFVDCGIQTLLPVL